MPLDERLLVRVAVVFLLKVLQAQQAAVFPEELVVDVHRRHRYRQVARHLLYDLREREGTAEGADEAQFARCGYFRGALGGVYLFADVVLFDAVERGVERVVFGDDVDGELDERGDVVGGEGVDLHLAGSADFACKTDHA